MERRVNKYEKGPEPCVFAEVYFSCQLKYTIPAS